MIFSVQNSLIGIQKITGNKILCQVVMQNEDPPLLGGNSTSNFL
jgi:hypothetical protein